MKERIVLCASLLLLATPFCYAHGYTLAEANSIIVILIIIVIALIGCGGYTLYYNRIISQRNEQLRRILMALDDYRALVGDGVLSLDEQEEVLKEKLSKPKEVRVVQKDEKQNFFVVMDARVNKERPFTDPDFDHEALVKFMGVTNETFSELVPRYKDPDRTLDYINSLRAEYAAKILMEHSDYSVEDIARKCGFKSIAAYNSAFKFSFGITPTDYLSSMSQMFKKKENESPVM
jgi:AraC-like DNA-binding protein